MGIHGINILLGIIVFELILLAAIIAIRIALKAKNNKLYEESKSLEVEEVCCLIKRNLDVFKVAVIPGNIAYTFGGIANVQAVFKVTSYAIPCYDAYVLHPKSLTKTK